MIEADFKFSKHYFYDCEAGREKWFRKDLTDCNSSSVYIDLFLSFGKDKS